MAGQCSLCRRACLCTGGYLEATLEPRGFDLLGVQLRVHAIQSAPGWRVRVRGVGGRGFGLVRVRGRDGVGGLGAHSARIWALSFSFSMSTGEGAACGREGALATAAFNCCIIVATCACASATTDWACDPAGAAAGAAAPRPPRPPRGRAAGPSVNFCISARALTIFTSLSRDRLLPCASPTSSQGLYRYGSSLHA